jgi:hypothetical protein
MLLAAFSNFITLASLFGYVLISKKIFFHNEVFSKVKNIDFFYGLLFLIFLSLFLNFFFPLKYFTLPVIIIGITIFLIGIKKNYYEINFIFYFLIVFLITFISFYSRDNVDSPMYHLQIIKWLSLHKVNFGIANLEVRLGFNSTWHSFVALMNLTINQFSSKYYLSTIIFSFVLYEGLHFRKINRFSNIFLYLTICYLFTFSLLHPAYYGVVLNHLGNPERDIASMFLYFSFFYLFIKLFEETRNSKEKKNLINLCFISFFICITTRITTIPIILMLFYILYKNKNLRLITYGNIFILFVGFLWVLRSFVLSGCLVFPIIQSCFDTSWSADINVIKFLVEEAMRYSRTLPSLDRVTDFNFTLYTYDWLIPWFKNYFLEAALLQIGTLIIIFSIILMILKFIFFKNKKSLNFKINDLDLVILITFVIQFIFWMQAPEIRYAWGMLFALPCYLMIICLKYLFSDKIININYKFLLSSFSIIFFLFFLKSLTVFKKEDFFKVGNRTHDFSKIKKLGTFDNIDVYFNYWQCADYPGVCVNIPKKEYRITKKFSYTFFENNLLIK